LAACKIGSLFCFKAQVKITINQSYFLLLRYTVTLIVVSVICSVNHSIKRVDICGYHSSYYLFLSGGNDNNICTD